MDLLRGIGEFMRREGIRELEIVDGDCHIYLRLAPPAGAAPHPGSDERETILSPISGVLHLSRPGEKNILCPPGAIKSRGEVLFYVEALKHLHEICAPFDLVVEEVLCEDGAPVREGEALLRVRKEVRP